MLLDYPVFLTAFVPHSVPLIGGRPAGGVLPAADVLEVPAAVRLGLQLRMLRGR
jgi:hypothetical protein